MTGRNPYSPIIGFGEMNNIFQFHAIPCLVSTKTPRLPFPSTKATELSAHPQHIFLFVIEKCIQGIAGNFRIMLLIDCKTVSVKAIYSRK